MGYDVQAQIDTVLKELTVHDDEDYLINHVKRHQEGHNLTRQATLNNIADALATITQESLPWQQQNSSPPLHPASQIGMSINNKVITRTINCEIYQAFTSIEFRTYLEEKFQLKQNIVDLLIRNYMALT
eukprot:15338081-Ditylum_brightwellii.AAC.1